MDVLSALKAYADAGLGGPKVIAATPEQLGAAGAIEAVLTVQTIREGCVPPTINLVDPEPEGAGLDLTPNSSTVRPVRVALSNSFGFGGQNTALIFAAFGS